MLEVWRITYLQVHTSAQTCSWVGPRMQNDHPCPVHLCLLFVFPLYQLHSPWGFLLEEPTYSSVHPTCLATTEESVHSPRIQWVFRDNSNLVWFGSHAHFQIYLWTGVWDTHVSPDQEVGQATLRVTGREWRKNSSPEEKWCGTTKTMGKGGKEKTTGIHYTPISNPWK